MEIIRDYSVKAGISASGLVGQMSSAGFQASEIGEAARLMRKMKEEKATIFLSFTANMAASGLRGIFARMAREKMVDAIITTGGSIDHDVIRTEMGYPKGYFQMDDEQLHRKGINRLGNILVPNDRYVFFEKKMQALFSELYGRKKVWTPSELCLEIGKSLKDEGSFLYWAARNGIPVFCPGITDSALGLQVYFFRQENKEFIIDVAGDMRLADIVINSKKTGGIILGGGIAKHHTIGVNILKEGLDYAIYVSTSSPWDGSLSGAVPSEAKSWGKIREKGNSVVVYGDATVIFPLIMVAAEENGDV